MKTFLTITLILLSTSTLYNDIQANLSIEIQDVNRLERWLSFYNLKITDFTDTIKFEKPNIEHNKCDYQLDAKDIYRQFYIPSPNSRYLIDLDSYSLVLEKDSNGQLVSFGSEVDTEVSLIDNQAKVRFRILFYGPEVIIQEAYWLNNDKVYILGFSRKIDTFFPTIWLYKINDNSLVVFESQNSIISKELDYPIKTRLKTISFK